MPKFRKKPVVIDAVQFNASTNESELLALLEGTPWRMDTEIRRRFGTNDEIDYPCIVLSTLEGEMRASVGDWIIKGVKGEIYPCKPDIFAATYEQIVE